MATGYLHNQFESLPGNEVNTPTLSTKILYTPLRSFQPKLNPNPLERDDELRGVDEPIAVLPEIYAPDFDLETRAYPDVLGFELMAALAAPVTTAGNGVITDPDGGTIPTGATRHVWTAPFGVQAGSVFTNLATSPPTVQRTAAYRDEGTYIRQKGCATSQLVLDTPDSGGMSLKASGPANHAVRISDPALSPTYESLVVAPFMEAFMSIPTWLASTAIADGLGVQIDSPSDPVRTMGVASRFPDLVEKGDAPIVFSGSVDKRRFAAADWDALAANTGFAVRLKWLSTVVIASGYRYTLWIELLNCQYLEGQPEALANRRRTGATFNWKSTFAGTPGSSKVTLVNASPSYA